MREQLRLLLSDRKPALYLFRRAVLIVLKSDPGWKCQAAIGGPYSPLPSQMVAMPTNRGSIQLF